MVSNAVGRPSGLVHPAGSGTVAAVDVSPAPDSVLEEDRTPLGIVADDFTGASDVGSLLAEAGLRVVVEAGVLAPRGIPTAITVVALRTRTAPVADAVETSRRAAQRLIQSGARQLFFKYCSTFDSTPRGNIGPVADALADLTGASVTVICPAYPALGRTVRDGILSVHGVPLAETSMARHPLTPMLDSELTRLLRPQTPRPVGRIPLEVVRDGVGAVRGAVARAERVGDRYLVVDAETDEDIEVIAEAVADAPLATGGAALGAALGRRTRRSRRPGREAEAQRSPAREDGPASGRAGIVLAGSVSSATQAQVAHWVAAGRPAYRLAPARDMRPAVAADTVLGWIRGQDPRTALLVYSTADAGDVAEVQAALGVAAAAAWVEEVLARVGAAVVHDGVERLVVAGGETSGAVVSALPAPRFLVGPTIAPGVPWLTAADGRPLAVALKSGNFGGPDFFSIAVDHPIHGAAPAPGASS